MEKKEYKCTAATKEALFQAIISLANEKEYDKITIRDICNRAEISIGSFYHHFRSKEELAKATCSHVDQLINPDFVELCKKNSPEENLYHVLKIYAEYVSQAAGRLLKAYYKVLVEETSVSVFMPEGLYYKTVQNILKDWQENGGISQEEDLTDLTDYCIRSVRGLFFDWCLHDCSYDLIHQFEKDYRKFIYGLKGE